MVSNLFQMRNVLATCLLLLTMLASASTAFSIPVTTYRDHVHRSFLALDSVRAKVINGTEVTSTGDDAVVTLKEIRYLLPPKETVESEGTSLQIDNTWLETILVRIEDPSISADDRKRLLTQATERLAALDIALAELDKLESSNASTTSKDEARARLSNIQRRDEYAKKAADGNALTRVWQRFVTWLRGIFPNAPHIEPGRAKFFSQIAQVLIVGLALAVIAFVAWKFWPRIWRLNAKSKKGGKREARIVLGERLEADQSSADLLAEAEALARDGQLRAAIRKGYIALLCELGDRKVLGLEQHKTNRDYLYSVRSHEQLYKEMQILTNSFENHWYGFVPANMDDWNMFRARYQQALTK
jgi:hypothetical protein